MADFFASRVCDVARRSDVSMKEELTAMLSRFESTRQYRWQYLEYMTRDTWVDYDEETQIAWDSYEKMRLIEEKILGKECDICFATLDLRGSYLKKAPHIEWIESSFPWVEVWPEEAKYWTKNITNGIQSPVRCVRVQVSERN